MYNNINYFCWKERINQKSQSCSRSEEFKKWKKVKESQKVNNNKWNINTIRHVHNFRRFSPLNSCQKREFSSRNFKQNQDLKNDLLLLFFMFQFLFCIFSLLSFFFQLFNERVGLWDVPRLDAFCDCR